MADSLRIGGKEYTFPEADAGVLEDCEAEINALFFDLPTDAKLMLIGPRAKAARVLVHRILSAKYPDLTPEAVKTGLSAKLLFAAMPMIAHAFGFEVSATPGEADGPPASG